MKTAEIMSVFRLRARSTPQKNFTRQETKSLSTKDNFVSFYREERLLFVFTFFLSLKRPNANTDFKKHEADFSVKISMFCVHRLVNWCTF